MPATFLALLLAAIAVAGLAAFGIVLWRSRHSADPKAATIAELMQAQRDGAARLEAMLKMLSDRQSLVQHAVNERLDSVSHRLGDSLPKTTQHTTQKFAQVRQGVL